MRNNAGITLFECLIYIVLFSFIATAGASIVARLWMTGMKSAAIARSRLTLYSAFDAFYREIQSAPSSANQWKMISPACIIWSNEDAKDICWHTKNNMLFRTEGIYNADKAIWKKKYSASMAPITHLSFKVYDADSISALEIDLSDGITTIHETIALQNRKINVQ